jgi:hypothetical protein
MNLQEQYDKICSFFKTTTEPFDELDWNGKLLSVIFNNRVVKEYSYDDLKKLINDF